MSTRWVVSLSPEKYAGLPTWLLTEEQKVLTTRRENAETFDCKRCASLAAKLVDGVVVEL
jgi:hypothetical protein